MMLTASIVTIAAVALAYQITLPQISDIFQFYGDGTGKYDFAANAVILGTVADRLHDGHQRASASS